MHVAAIVVAAGKGIRFSRGSGRSKVLREINSRPIIAYSLAALNRHPLIRDIVVVANASNRQGIAAQIRRFRIDKAREIVLGGSRRQDSVACGLRAVPAGADTVLIHDAARPFIGRGIITGAIRAAQLSGAAIVAVPVVGTVKKVTPKLQVNRTVDRSDLWEVQTPQVFRKDIILEAYRRFGATLVTDDAMLVEKMKRRVSVVMGSYGNIKITTPEDLAIAGAIAKKMRSRI